MLDALFVDGCRLREEALTHPYSRLRVGGDDGIGKEIGGDAVRRCLLSASIRVVHADQRVLHRHLVPVVPVLAPCLDGIVAALALASLIDSLLHLFEDIVDEVGVGHIVVLHGVVAIEVHPQRMRHVHGVVAHGRLSPVGVIGVDGVGQSDEVPSHVLLAGEVGRVVATHIVVALMERHRLRGGTVLLGVCPRRVAGHTNEAVGAHPVLDGSLIVGFRVVLVRHLHRVLGHDEHAVGSLTLAVVDIKERPLRGVGGLEDVVPLTPLHGVVVIDEVLRRPVVVNLSQHLLLLASTVVGDVPYTVVGSVVHGVGQCNDGALVDVHGALESHRLGVYAMTIAIKARALLHEDQSRGDAHVEDERDIHVGIVIDFRHVVDMRRMVGIAVEQIDGTSRVRIAAELLVGDVCGTLPPRLEASAVEFVVGAGDTLREARVAEDVGVAGPCVHRLVVVAQMDEVAQVYRQEVVGVGLREPFHIRGS